jgi:acetylornithine deacetylase
MDTLAILEQLVSFATVSGDPNRPLTNVRAFLAGHRIESELVEAEGGRKANLFATIGPRDSPGIMLSGHTDVVPIDGQRWSSNPFQLRVADGRAFGRGHG